MSITGVETSILDLPDERINDILKFLTDNKDMHSIGATCRRMRALICDPESWTDRYFGGYSLPRRLYGVEIFRNVAYSFRR